MAVVKGGSGGTLRAAAVVTAVVAVVMLSNSINGCGAAVLLKTSVTYDDGNWLMGEELELEFLMDSHVARFLQDNNKPTSDIEVTADRNKPAYVCGKTKMGAKYCHPKAQKSPKNKNENKGKYSR